MQMKRAQYDTVPVDDFEMVRRVGHPGTAVPETPRRADSGQAYVELKELRRPTEFVALSSAGKGDLLALKGGIRALGKPTGGSLPPTLNVSPTLKQVFRFKATASSGVAVTVGTLFGALGGICTVANSKVQSWCSSARIKSVTLWPAPSTSTTPTPYLVWDAGQSGQIRDEQMDGSIPEGTAVTKALRFLPPAGSLCGFWISAADSSATLFAVQAVSGMIVDLAVDYTLASGLGPVAASTVVSGTLGSVYYLALDGPSSNKLVPTTLPTTS